MPLCPSSVALPTTTGRPTPSLAGGRLAERRPPLIKAVVRVEVNGDVLQAVRRHLERDPLRADHLGDGVPNALAVEVPAPGNRVRTLVIVVRDDHDLLGPTEELRVLIEPLSGAHGVRRGYAVPRLQGEHVLLTLNDIDRVATSDTGE